MRKSNVLALVIVVALIAVLLLLWTFVSGPPRNTAGGRTEPAKTDEPALSTEHGAELEPSSANARADVNARRDGDGAQHGAEKPVLRIEVRYASERDEHPEGLEVGISNRMGELFQPRHTAPNEFLLVEEPPDVYLIAAKASGFRTAVVRAALSPKTPETKATVTLTRERNVLVRWRADDGRPIVTAIADPKRRDQITLLEVYLTKFSASESPRPLDRHALALWRGNYVIDEGPEDHLTARDTFAPVWLAPVPPDPSRLPDTIITLPVAEDGLLWANAYCGGEWVASLPVQPGQHEVEFVTALDDLTSPGGSAKLVVVDGESGLPVEGAGLFVDGDNDGGGARSNAEGVLVREGIPAGRHRANAWTEGYRETNVSFTTRAGETVDLGTVRLVATHPSALFDVVAAKDEIVQGTNFELVALEDDADSTRPRPMHVATCEYRRPGEGKVPAANLRFDDVQRGRYLLRCRSQGLDAAPRIVEPQELRLASDTAPIAQIVVRAAGPASFVLDAPIAKGTQIVIETPAGHPLRELDVDEYGVATTDLLAGDYRLHLVEYGRATDAVDVRVDTNPFLFEIHR